MRSVSFLVSLVLVLLPANALACSLREDFVPAHNYDLVAHADAIAVAEAIGEAPDGSWGAVVFRTLSALKGRPPATFTAGLEIGHPPFSDPNGISEPNPLSAWGACQRYTYRRNGVYVMFLRREEGEWREIDYPYARANEDYYGDESAWVRAIRAYVTIQARYQGEEAEQALLRLEVEYRRRADQQSQMPDDSWAILAEDISWRRHPFFVVSPFLPASQERPTPVQIAAGEAIDYPQRRPEPEARNLSRVSFIAAIVGFVALIGSLAWAAWVALRIR